MNPSRSARSSRFTTSMPPIMSLWPLRYLVVECSTMSAPTRKRLLEAGRRKGVVDREEVAMGLRQVAQRRQVGQVHHRVGGRLAVDQPRGRRQHALHVPDVAHVGEGERQAEIGVEALHEAMRAAVDIGAADDVVTRLEELEDRVERRETGTEGEAVAAALEARHVALECLAGRVLGPGVLVALVLPQAFLGVGRRLVDRRHDRAGHGVGYLAGSARRGWQSRVRGRRSGSWS